MPCYNAGCPAGFSASGKVVPQAAQSRDLLDADFFGGVGDGGGAGGERVGAQACELQGHVREERRIVAQVAKPEASWILEKAVEPLQAGVLDPGRTVAQAAGVKVEGGADAEHDPGLELGKHVAHEPVLFGRADADPDHVGPGAIDGGDEC